MLLTQSSFRGRFKEMSQLNTKTFFETYIIEPNISDRTIKDFCRGSSTAKSLEFHKLRNKIVILQFPFWSEPFDHYSDENECGWKGFQSPYSCVQIFPVFWTESLQWLFFVYVEPIFTYFVCHAKWILMHSKQTNYGQTKQNGLYEELKQVNIEFLLENSNKTKCMKAKCASYTHSVLALYYYFLLVQKNAFNKMKIK